MNNGRKNNSPNKNDHNIPVPAIERIKLFYALGFRKAEICKAINEELSDILVYTMDVKRLDNLLKDNKEEFEEFRLTMQESCRLDVQNQITGLYKKASVSENKIIDIYSEKISEALDELRNVDLAERTEDGKISNAPIAFTLMSLIEKMQLAAGKLAGTDAMREIEIYKQRITLDAQAKALQGNSLLPAKNSQSNTNFLEI